MGDYLDYTINPNIAGTFSLQLRVAAPGGGTIEIRNQDSAVLATVTVPATGDWQNWTTVETVVNLLPGTQNIRLKAVSSGWNINWLQFGLVGSPLPVKFVYFNAQCKGGAVNLQWKTAQEQSSSRFAVQRSSDGSNWSEIGSMTAAGQSTAEKNYTFVDKNASSNASMYRIVEYDYSGQQIMSSIVKSNCSAKTEVSLYPNPSSGNSALNITLERSTNLTLQIVDAKGSVVQQKQVLLPSGSNTLPLNLTGYPDGVYTINVNYNQERKSLKLIKK